jgi:nitroreductase
MKDHIIEAFHFRHACKVFDETRKISGEDFHFILETARLSPSSFGFEPWKLLVVQDPALRERLREHTWGGKKQIPTASHFLVVLAKKGFFMRYDSDYVLSIMRDIKHLDDEAIALRRGFYETFQKSDFRLLESERALFDWASKQTYIAQANMMTAAALIGIDSCPIEGFKADGVEAVVRDAFGVDLVKYGVSYMLAFGYRLNPAPAKTRQDMNAIVEWY